MDINFEHRLTAIEEKGRIYEKRVEDIEKRQDDLEKLTMTVQALAIREENIETAVEEIKEDVKTLTGKSSKRWDGLVDKVILTVAAAVVGFILARLGLM